jgi:large subunit ribosomal protein L22
MEVIARSSFVRMSSEKLRPLARKINKKRAKVVLPFLSRLGKRGEILMEVLKQGIANAKNNFGLSEDNLVIKEIQINNGPIYKRWRAVSRGQAHPIRKRTSHIKIVLEEVSEENSQKGSRKEVSNGTKS